MSFADRVVDYPIDNKQHAVIVAIDGISASEARKIGVQRAAEITASQGNRYFVIVAEQQTQMIKSDNDQNNRFYGNMYQELIIENDSNRGRLRDC